jgi:hypothetical protein
MVIRVGALELRRTLILWNVNSYGNLTCDKILFLGVFLIM